MNQKSNGRKRWLAFILSAALILTNLNVPVIFAADYPNDISEDKAVYEEVIGSAAEDAGAEVNQDISVGQDDTGTVSPEETVGASNDAAGEGLDIAQVLGEDLGENEVGEAAPQVDAGIPIEVVEQDLTEDEALVGQMYPTWSSLQTAINNAADGSTIELDGGIDAGATDKVLKIPEGKTITLDLAGFTLDRRLHAQDDDGHVIEVLNTATFTLMDSSAEGTGTLKGGYGTNGGAVNVHSSATMYMQGGNITENNSVNGGGVCNKGTFIMSGGRITGNTAEKGGGIWSEGDLTIEGGVIDGNTATVDGGGIYTQNDLTMQGGKIDGNTSIDGGGIFVQSGTATITDGEITNNIVTVEDGGGIVNKGDLTIEGGLISGNKTQGTSSSDGGGIWSRGALTITGGEINGNEASCDGGGIFFNDQSSSVLICGNAAIEENSAAGSGGGIYAGRAFTMSEFVTVKNNQAGTNGGGICTAGNITLTDDLNGNPSDVSPVVESNTVKDKPNNLYLDGNKIVIEGQLDNPLFGITLKGVKGTFTSGLNGNGRINNQSSELSQALCRFFFSDNEDYGVSFDESREAKIGTFWSLLQDKIDANGDTKTITLDRDVKAEAGENYISIAKNVTIDLAGHTLDRDLSASDGDGHVLYVHDGGELIIKDSSGNNSGKITGGWANNGGGVNVQESSKFTLQGGTITGNNAEVSGGGIKNYGTTTISGGVILEHDSVNGGAISNKGTLTMTGGELRGNTAKLGGGIYNEGTLDVQDGLLKTNTASKDGGGIYNIGGTLTMSGGQIDDNRSVDGGGIFNEEGTVTVSGDALISNNYATSEDGGGIVNKDTLNVEGGTISGNEAECYGGGIWTKGTMTLTGGTIFDNKAKIDGGGISIHADNSDVSISGPVVISGNEASANGGGIATRRKLTIGEDVEISANSAATDGGGIWTNAELILNGGSLAGNKATAGNGGGICTSATLTLNGGSITENEAGTNGGGICTSGTLNLYGGSVQNNTASGLGGGIYTTGSVNLKGNPAVGGSNETNLYLANNQKISIKDSLTDGCLVGITLAGGKGVFTSGLKNKGGQTNFSSDDTSMDVGMTSDGEAQISSYWDEFQGRIYQAKDGDTVSLTRDIKAAANDDRIKVEGKNITIDLNGFTMDRGLQEADEPDEDGHVIQVISNATLTIIDSSEDKTGTITGGNAQNGGGINLTDSSSALIFKGGTIEGNIANQGGGILNRGTLTIDGGIIQNNTANTRGGGIYNNKGTVTFSEGSISGNTTPDGGGIFNNEGTVTVSGTAEITNNKSTVEDGGGIVNKDKLYIEGGTISGNEVAGYGGGIWSNSALYLHGGTITGNKADTKGDGIYVPKGTVSMKGGPVVTGNTKTNLYLNDVKINIEDDLSETCKVGITLNSGKGEFTSGFDGKGAPENFESDDETLMVSINANKEAVLGSAWKQLQSFIDAAADGATVTVEHDYKADEDDTRLELKGKSITLDLNGKTLDRGLQEASAPDANGHVIQVSDGATLTIVDSSDDKTGTITGGNAGNGGGINVTDSASTLNFNGGTIEGNNATKGGGILVRGTLTIDGGIVKENTSTAGGGIYSDGGTVTLVSGQVDSNTCPTGNGGGIYCNGGSLDINGGQINSNTATATACDGGGIYNDGATVTFNSGQVNSNTSADGGGIFNQSGTVTVKDGAEIKNNTVTDEDGGGIVNKDELYVEGGLISGNTAKVYGGGIWSKSKLYLYGGTIAENSAETEGGGIYVADGSAYMHGAPIVEDNTVNNVIDNVYLNGKKITIDGDLSEEANIGVTLKGTKGVITSGLNGQGKNASETGELSKLDTSANFASDLTDYAVVVNTDGEAEVMTTWRVMQNAINAANEMQTITLDIDVTADADDTRFEINNGVNVIIDLAGHTIDEKRTSGNADGHIFQINSGGTLTVRDSSGDNSGKITGGWAGNGGAINVNASGSKFYFEGGTITGNTAQDGGAILSRGDVVISGGVITENTALNEGGAIWHKEGTLTITGGSITLNTALDGGGIFIESGTANINETKGEVIIDGNKSTELDGGGIVNKGTLTIADATISNNIARTSGGGIWSNNNLTITDVTISNNTAEYDGGGIYSKNDTLTITGGTIEKNTATKDGGGIWITDGCTLTVENTVIDSNTAEDGGGIFIETNGVATVKGTTQITNNTVMNEDGGGIVNKGTLTIQDDVLIKRNVVHGNGGGVWTYNRLNLYGGTITENDADGKGSGIYYSNGSIHIKGNPVVADNDETNVYLPKDKKLTIDEALGEEAKIGISMEKSGVFTSGLNGESIDSFTSDDNAYKVTLSSKDEAELTDNEVYVVTLNPGEGSGQVLTANVSAGGTYVLPEYDKDCEYTAPEGKAFAGWKDDDLGIVCNAGEEIPVNCDMSFAAQWSNVGDTAIIQSATVLFEGLLRIRLKYTIPESYLAAGKIVFEKNGEEISSIALADGTEKNGTRFYELGVMIPEYADEIVARLVDGAGNPIPVKANSGTDYTDGFTYSVKQYAENMKKNGSTAEMKALAKALDDYGKAAQIYFQYGDYEGLVLSSEVKTLGIDEMEVAATSVQGTKPEGLGAVSQTVLFQEDNTLRVSFTTSNKKLIYKLDGKEVVAKKSGKRYYVDVPNIAAPELANDHVFLVTDGKDNYQVTTSCLAYAKSRAKNSESADMKNLAKALYLYYEAAADYFSD